MSNLLFLTWDGGGNVPPALGIAAELQRRGHRVRVMGHPGQHANVSGRGAGLHLLPHCPRPLRQRTTAHLSTTWVSSVTGRWVATSSRRCVASPPTSWSSTASCSGRWRRSRRRESPYVVLEHMYDAYLVRKWLRGPMGIGMALKRIPTRKLLDGAAARLVACTPELGSLRQPPATEQPSLHRTRRGWCPGCADRADGARQPQHGQLPGAGSSDAEHPRCARHARRPRHRHGRAFDRDREPGRSAERRAPRLRPPRRAAAAGVDGDRSRWPRHHDGRAGPRPAGAGDADAPHAGPEDGRAVAGRRGRGPAAVQEGETRRHRGGGGGADRRGAAPSRRRASGGRSTGDAGEPRRGRAASNRSAGAAPSSDRTGARPRGTYGNALSVAAPGRTSPVS